MPLPPVIQLKSLESVSATVQIPGSKSITNRAFVIAALASGESNLRGALHSDDTEAMTSCLAQLGVLVHPAESGETKIIGTSGKFAAPAGALFVKNSGTTIRFLTAAAAYAPSNSTVVLDGIARMRQRPIKDLCDALEQLGVSAETSGNGCPPVHITGGGIPGGHCRIKGTLSSQFLSALLMAAPYAASDVTIEVDGDLVSKPYVDMTLSMMEDFGITAENHNYESFNIPARQTYLGRDYAIEPDASNASYFLAAAAVTGGTVTVEHLGTDSIQGDIAFVDVLEMMGCIVSKTPHSFTVTGPAQLLPIDFDATRIPDMAQTLAVAACFASGPSRLSGLKTLRVKETDRISAMATELRKIGVSVIEGPESLLITPPPEFTSAAIDTYDDHRMAMSFAVAGLKVDNLVINDPGCVAKTFPDFWNRWDRAFPGSIVSF